MTKPNDSPTPQKRLGRRPLGLATKCHSCGDERTRWVYEGEKRLPACSVCYIRVHRGGAFKGGRRRTVESHRLSIAKAKALIKKGVSLKEAAAQVGMSRATMLARMGRLALETKRR